MGTWLPIGLLSLPHHSVISLKHPLPLPPSQPLRTECDGGAVLLRLTINTPEQHSTACSPTLSAESSTKPDKVGTPD